MKFRKKPVVIEAEQFHYESKPWPDGVKDFDGVPYISTLEGLMRVSEGDYVITGVVGEKYPCKEDIFTQTYEPVYND